MTIEQKIALACALVFYAIGALSSIYTIADNSRAQAMQRERPVLWFLMVVFLTLSWPLLLLAERVRRMLRRR